MMISGAKKTGANKLRSQISYFSFVQIVRMNVMVHRECIQWPEVITFLLAVYYVVAFNPEDDGLRALISISGQILLSPATSEDNIPRNAFAALGALMIGQQALFLWPLKAFPTELKTFSGLCKAILDIEVLDSDSGKLIFNYAVITFLNDKKIL